MPLNPCLSHLVQLKIIHRWEIPHCHFIRPAENTILWAASEISLSCDTSIVLSHRLVVLDANPDPIWREYSWTKKPNRAAFAQTFCRRFDFAPRPDWNSLRWLRGRLRGLFVSEPANFVELFVCEHGI